MPIGTVGVVGAGLMGSGIAEVCARQGLRTKVCELDSGAMAAARARVERSLARCRSTGKLDDKDVDRILAQLSFTDDVADLGDCDIARATSRADRVIGTHFFNPAPVMRLLEVVRSIATSDDTLAETRAFGEKLGKRIIVAQDRGGFIVNLLLIPFLTHAVRLYIGLDTTLFVCDALHAEYANADYAAPPLLRRMVAAGWLGQKSGRGFYLYDNGKIVA